MQFLVNCMVWLHSAFYFNYHLAFQAKGLRSSFARPKLLQQKALKVAPKAPLRNQPSKMLLMPHILMLAFAITTKPARLSSAWLLRQRILIHRKI